MKKFRICKFERINQYGDVEYEYYYLQRRKSFLGIKYWSSLKQEIIYPNGIMKIRTEFKRYVDAFEFYKKLTQGIEPNSYNEKILNYL